ncbi:MAG: SDR family oxidoreductase [Erysipelotrichaceae bacterium]|nr:SDR family oxidoreductase [Erysipelotrichaceae bacterium]
MGKLEGKIVILTGAASGLGKFEAIRMAEEGANLTICDIQAEKLEITKQLCEERGAQVIAYPCDVRSYDSLKNMVEKTVEKFGTVDVLVNNVHCTTLKPFIDMDIETFKNELEISAFSAWHLMQLCFPYMKNKPGAGASIVNFGSRWGQESPKMSATYSAVKEVVRSLTRTVAREWGEYNIRVNCICPGGFTDNAKNDMDKQLPEMQAYAMEAFKDNVFHRAGDPYEDVAPILVFLASDDSHWMSGQTVNADGGGWITA